MLNKVHYIAEAKRKLPHIVTCRNDVSMPITKSFKIVAQYKGKKTK